MISAYAKAAIVLQSKEYADIAEWAVDFINTRLIDEDGKLYVRYREGEAANNGNLDDYAYLCQALLCVYDATFDIRYLKQAIDIADKMLLDFWDDINEGFFLTSNESEELIYRPKEVYDGATPSGNSVAGYVLQKIAHITANPKYKEHAHKQLRFLAGQAKNYPAGYCYAQLAFLTALYPSKEIICVVSNKDDNITTAKTVKRNPQENPELEELKEYMASHYNPNMTVVVKTKQNEEELQKIVDYVKNYQTIDNKTTYYICEDHHCQTPVTKL
ncbi:MAG: AGE family epimerase/isomerase [Herbinix sp.]|nr:AGE family epimerase/isomerase [Herbinix sp.]